RTLQTGSAVSPTTDEAPRHSAPRSSVWVPPWISRRPVVTSPATLPRPNSSVDRGSPSVRHVQPSETDVRRLLVAVRDDPLEALVWLALGSGLRRAEVAGLKW